MAEPTRRRSQAASRAETERRPPRADRRSTRAQRAILAATTELISEVGYASTTVDEIARRAGVGKQTIYRWWSSKGELVIDAVLNFRSHTDIDVEASDLDTGDFEGDLRRFVVTLVREFATSEFSEPHRALVTASQEDPELAAMASERAVLPGMTLLLKWLDDARRDGRMRPINTGIATELIVGPVFHRWLLRTAPLDDAYASSLSDTLVELLLP